MAACCIAGMKKHSRGREPAACAPCPPPVLPVTISIMRQMNKDPVPLMVAQVGGKEQAAGAAWTLLPATSRLPACPPAHPRTVSPACCRRHSCQTLEGRPPWWATHPPSLLARPCPATSVGGRSGAGGEVEGHVHMHAQPSGPLEGSSCGMGGIGAPPQHRPCSLHMFCMHIPNAIRSIPCRVHGLYRQHGPWSADGSSCVHSPAAVAVPPQPVRVSVRGAPGPESTQRQRVPTPCSRLLRPHSNHAPSAGSCPAPASINASCSPAFPAARLPTTPPLWRRSTPSASPTGPCLPSAVSCFGSGCFWQ